MHVPCTTAEALAAAGSVHDEPRLDSPKRGAALGALDEVRVSVTGQTIYIFRHLCHLRYPTPVPHSLIPSLDR